MDPAFITPFIASIQNVFSTMMQLPVTMGTPNIKMTPATTYDVSGIIGMSGDVTGNVVLSFPKSTATRVVQLLTGTEFSVDSPDFADAIGELTNMVAGGAKGMFQGKKKVSISTPSVVIGAGHTVARPREVPVICIPCQTDCGELIIEVAVQASAVPAAQAA
jgi:chemotaxis protein CheX